MKKNADEASFRQLFAQLLKARHPALLIESFEEDRVVEEITAVAGNGGGRGAGGPGAARPAGSIQGGNL